MNEFKPILLIFLLTILFIEEKIPHMLHMQGFLYRNFFFDSDDDYIKEINQYIDRKIPPENHKPKNKATIFFGIITETNSTDRREQMGKIWLNRIVKHGHDYIYVNNQTLKDTNKIIFTKKWVNMTFNKDRDREFKRLTVAEYFLHNTTCDFFLTLTDDVFVDPIQLDIVLSELGKKYDTNKDVAILGHCMVNHQRKVYLQGGSGYIMTRACAEKFVSYGAEWVKKSKGADDLAITDFIKHINISMKDTAIDFMIGHTINELMNETIDFISIKKCPKVKIEPKCMKGLIQFNNMAIVHPPRENRLLYIKNIENLLAYSQLTGIKYAWYCRWPLINLCVL